MADPAAPSRCLMSPDRSSQVFHGVAEPAGSPSLSLSDGLKMETFKLISTPPPGNSTNRVGRLIRERMRKTQSNVSGPDLADEQDLADTPPAEDPPEEGQQRLILIANRLPVTAEKRPNGEWKLEMSAGGLVSALLGVANFQTTWIGWPGIYVPDGPDRRNLTDALRREGYVPVFLEETFVDLYYNGFCNQVLWQLFHYVPLNLDSKLTETKTLQTQWRAYKAANKAFADAALDIYQDGDVVWCQDYHLMILPEMLKNAHPEMKVGWFLHTPFPSSEIYRTLPVREEVLRSALRADLIGFHTYDYARHFVSACTRILGLEGCPEGVIDNGQLTRVAAFPIGIDPERFVRALDTTQVKAHIAELLNRYAGRKVMLGVDRLDMIKGIPQKLLAYEKFLEEHPEWRDKVLLVQIAVPSRTDVPEYQKLRSLVHEIVGRINGKFGTLTHVPIHHLDRGLAFIELCALYSITDVLLVTSLRDGMNLVSYEYVACQSDNAGVLVLSEFAGAAQSLGSGALLVNPWNIIDVSQAIGDALSMSDTERRERHRQMYVHVTVHTAQAWADTFISELNDTHVENELRIRHVPPRMNFPETVKAFQHAKGRRLIVLGYNATLTQAREAPLAPKRHFDQIKAETKVNSATCEYIQRLAAHPAVTVVIMSGSDRARLLDTFSNLEDVWLVAENGIYMRPPLKHSGPCGGDTWICNFPSLNSDWLDAVQLVFEYFCERTPRSYVEVRESSIVWSYKYADAEFGRLQARDLLQHLCTGPISNAPVDIIQGSRSVEVRPVGVSKGVAMLHMLSWIQDNIAPFAATFDYVLAIGHYLGRDENLYTYLEGHGVGSLQREQASHHPAHHPHLGLTSFGSGQWYNDLANSFSEHDTRTVSPEENSTSAEPLPLLPKPLSPLRTGKEARANDSGGGSPAHQKQPLAGDVRAYASPMAWRRDTRSFDDAEPCNPFKSPSGHRPSDGLREPPNHQKFQARNPREPLGAEVATMKLPPRHLFTCNIGKNQSRARYLIDSSKEVEELLLSMVEVLPDIAVPLPTLVRSESQRSAPDSGNCNSAPGSPLGARGRLRMRRSSFYC